MLSESISSSQLRLGNDVMYDDDGPWNSAMLINRKLESLQKSEINCSSVAHVIYIHLIDTKYIYFDISRTTHLLFSIPEYLLYTRLFTYLYPICIVSQNG